MHDLVAVQSMCIFQTAQDSQVDGVLVFGPGSERRGEDHFFGPNPTRTERIAQCQLVLRQRTGFIRTENVNPGQLFHRRQAGDDGLLTCQGSGAHSHRHREHSGHGHGDGSDRQDQRELQGRHHSVAAEQGHSENESHESDRNNDEVVANF